MMHSLKKSHVPDRIRTRITWVEIQCSTLSQRVDSLTQYVRDCTYDTLYQISVLFIVAVHHVISQPDLPTTADNLKCISGSMGHNSLLLHVLPFHGSHSRMALLSIGNIPYHANYHMTLTCVVSKEIDKSVNCSFL